ncbi:MAG: hypothetical protein ACRDNW_28170 [Trebonia sp.]
MADRVVYKGTTLSGVPDFAFVFGYTNAAWTSRRERLTTKADLGR